MKAFSQVSVPKQQNSFDDKIKYWKEVQVFPRSNFKDHQHQHHLTLISGVIPVRTTQCELLSGKTFPITSPAWNYQTEEFDGVDPIRDYNENDGVWGAVCLVLVHEWLENPATNPNPTRGPIAVFEMTKGIFEGIVGVGNAWGLENITDPANWPHICITGSAFHKGGNPNAALEYQIQGVPPRFQITKDYVDGLVQQGHAMWWNLPLFVESKSMPAGEMLPFLARNDYYSEPEIHAYAQQFMADSNRYRLVASEAQLPARPENVPEAEWLEWHAWDKVKEQIGKIFAKARGQQGIPQANGMTGAQPPLPAAAGGAPAGAGSMAPPPQMGGAAITPPPAGTAIAPPPAAGAAIAAPAAGAAIAPPAASAPAAIAPPAAAAPAAVAPPAAAAVTPPAAAAAPEAVESAPAPQVASASPELAAPAAVAPPAVTPPPAVAAPLPGAPGAPNLPPAPVAAPQM